MSEKPTRESLIQALIENRGFTREKAEAAMNILGSGFRRRGWVDGDPLSHDELGREFDRFMGNPAAATPEDSR